SYNLYQNYPNPFNPVTKISYDMPQDGKVKLMIYDILGREIKTLVNNEFRSAGKYITEFDGSGFASGVYFYRIQVSGGKDFTAIKKMILIK
ncbi:MAG: T9SS type A sorting domain-containing protein, partial [Ignavibacteria bacterium]|nr:T9SS type A sorting domain-containing protein [Ignavibacteria bacterium]